MPETAEAVAGGGVVRGVVGLLRGRGSAVDMHRADPGAVRRRGIV